MWNQRRPKGPSREGPFVLSARNFSRNKENTGPQDEHDDNKHRGTTHHWNEDVGEDGDGDGDVDENGNSY